MKPRYRLGDCYGSHDAYCFIFELGNEEKPYCSVFGANQQEAQTKAQRLVDLLNDPGMRIWVEVVEPQPRLRVVAGGRK